MGYRLRISNRRSLRTLGFTARLGITVLGSLGLLACSGKEPTEIVAGMTTQLRVPDDIRSVGVVVQQNGRVEFCESYSVTDGTATLPATIGWLNEGRSGKGPVTVQVLGLRTEDSAFATDCLTTRPESLEQQVRVIRRRRLSFVDDRIIYLPLPLKDSCRDELTCADDETCVGGKCVPMDIDSSSLPDYQDAFVFGNTNTCFDGNLCMPKGKTLPVSLTALDDCSFEVPVPEEARIAGGELNVRMFYESFGSEILDIDSEKVETAQHEGFSPSAGALVEGERMRFKLAKNLCESNYQKKRILALEATAACPSKRLFQPLCNDYTAPDPRSRDDAPQTGTCTIANLEAVESAVYVLLDRSRSMNKFYEGNDMSLTLKSTVGLPLSTPVAERTKVGFEFLPPSEAQCSNLDYATPRVAIGEVTEARDAIIGLLEGDAVLDDNPSSFFLQGALQGAYESVAAVRTSGQRFNRRAVVVVSNRDILNGQCSGVSATALANAAKNRADPVFTYAVALDDGEDAALSSATALAEAGGTRVIDGVNSEEDGARAVQDILTELGTCLYKVNRADAGGAARLPTTAKVAYIDVDRSTNSGTGESSRGVEIDYAEGCVDASSPVSGWNQGEDGLVRLCGQACEDLRRVVGNSAVTQLVQGRPAPAVPLVVTAPCSEFQVQSRNPG